MLWLVLSYLGHQREGTESAKRSFANYESNRGAPSTCWLSSSELTDGAYIVDDMGP